LEIIEGTGKSYTLSGCTSGSGSTYALRMLGSTDRVAWYTVGQIQTTEEMTFTEGAYPYYAVRVDVFSGTSVNVTIKPMLVDSKYKGTYQPYAKTNQQLTQDTTGLLDNTEVNGAVNIAPFDGTSQLINGVNVTFNADGSITADGANQDKRSTANIRLHIGYFTLRKGIKYKVSANKDGSIYSENPGRCIAVRQKDGAWKMSTDIAGNNSAYYTPLADTEMEIILAINTGLYVDNLTFYPMVTVASYNGPYVPYAKSNKELTEIVTEQLALSVISGNSGNVFDISCNVAYGRALVITPYSIGCLAYWSGAYHYIPIAAHSLITVTASNESSTGLTLTFAGSTVNVTIMSLTNRNDFWSGTRVS
jgi:hypothetical protein